MGAHADAQEQRLAAVVEVLAVRIGAGAEGEQLVTEFFGADHHAQVHGLAQLGEVAEVRFQAQQHLLGGVVLHRVGAELLAVGLEIMLGVHQAGGQLALGAVRQIGRIIIRGGNLGIKHGKRLRGRDVRGQQAVSGGGVAHIRQGDSRCQQ